jgi:hypothetical protein
MKPRSEVIENSLSCFHFGIASLVPAIGFFLAPLALNRFRFAVIHANDRWNPARFQLYLGALLASASLLVHALLGYFVYIRIIATYLNL